MKVVVDIHVYSPKQFNGIASLGIKNFGTEKNIFIDFDRGWMIHPDESPESVESIAGYEAEAVQSHILYVFDF
jgi:hypothetical protein